MTNKLNVQLFEYNNEKYVFSNADGCLINDNNKAEIDLEDFFKAESVFFEHYLLCTSLMGKCYLIDLHVMKVVASIKLQGIIVRKCALKDEKIFILTDRFFYVLQYIKNKFNIFVKHKLQYKIYGNPQMIVSDNFIFFLNKLHIYYDIYQNIFKENAIRNVEENNVELLNETLLADKENRKLLYVKYILLNRKKSFRREHYIISENLQRQYKLLIQEAYILRIGKRTLKRNENNLNKYEAFDIALWLQNKTGIYITRKMHRLICIHDYEKLSKLLYQHFRFGMKEFKYL